jgi:hypothetical protein
VPDQDCAGAVGLEFGLMRSSHDEGARGNGALVCGRGTSSYRQPVLEISAHSRIDDDAVKRAVCAVMYGGIVVHHAAGLGRS